MGKKTIIALLIGLALASLAEAQQPKKIPRIGFLGGASGETNLRDLRQGLRELGYVEGKNIIIEYRVSKGEFDRFHALAAELVRLKVDVIVTQGTPAAAAAKNATSTIPMSGGTDPVATGLVQSLARPGGNITGVTIMNEELAGKRLELLKETSPKVSRLGVLWNSTNPGTAVVFKQTQAAAQELSLSLQSLEVKTVNDLQGAFDAATRRGVNGLVLLAAAPIASHLKLVADLAVKNRLPSTYDRSEFVDAGGLMSYGPNVPNISCRAATYVDKVLKGANPGDLPVERPTKFEFVINLKTAKQIGPTIPQSVLFRADRVIKYAHNGRTR
jgi:putative tryptophan/tyrosine transport system substrate-binding protein